MALISIKNISIGFGQNPVLDQVNGQINAGDRITVIGRNGTGKTTLLKIVNREIIADEGTVSFQKNIKISYLSQEIPFNLTGTVFNTIIDGFSFEKELLLKYHELTEKVFQNDEKKLIAAMDELQHQMESRGVWEINKKVEDLIFRMELNPDEKFENLSAGMKRRVLFAQCLVGEPDLLMLDEPTNHMDIKNILLLEETLKKYSKSVLIVTHDRMLVNKISNRIFELDRGKLTCWNCDYKNFLVKKEEFLHAEQKHWKNFDKKLAEEEIWIRQGIKARRTRNEGRVRALIKMRETRRERRELMGNIKVDLARGGRSGKEVIKVKNISYRYANDFIVKNFSLEIHRGDRIGIIGPNGCGKSTLLKLFLNELSPEQGEVIHGTNLVISYFDQLRVQLDLNKSVRENVALGASNDIININGNNRHVIGYLQDFLFTRERAESKVSVLSGGERNRLILAKLFSNPSNLLILDEPTNDLDIETLELLEEVLLDYNGTVILVSHDRTFLNNVISNALVFKDQGNIEEFIGGYSDWEKVFKNNNKPEKVKKHKKLDIPKRIPDKTKLVYKEKRELEDLPGKIEKFEEEKENLLTIMSDPDFFKSGSDEIASAKKRLEFIEEELEILYQRWELLEEKK